MRLTVVFALSIFVGVVGCQPTGLTRSPDRQLQELLYEQWPGVEDERDADAELDNAYELYKHKTRKPMVRQDISNAIDEHELS